MRNEDGDSYGVSGDGENSKWFVVTERREGEEGEGKGRNGRGGEETIAKSSSRTHNISYGLLMRYFVASTMRLRVVVIEERQRETEMLMRQANLRRKSKKIGEKEETTENKQRK